VLTSGVGRYGHTMSLQWLESIGVHLLGHLRSVSGARLAFDDDLGATIRAADESSAATNRQIAAVIAERELDATLPPLENDPADEPHPDPSSVHSPETLDVDTPTRAVIWSTGFGGCFDFSIRGSRRARRPAIRDGEDDRPGPTSFSRGTRQVRAHLRDRGRCLSRPTLTAHPTA
jgi:hypothetical protein